MVEGKYDKVRIESLLDATVLTTEGFGIFKNKEKRLLFKKLAEKRGIVILSDPDGAGKVIRGHLHNITGGKGITDLYVPEIFGKERRKSTSSKEGLLGVEGIDNETILSLFEKSGLIGDQKEKLPSYTQIDLYTLGYFGKEDSKAKREKVLSEHNLPKNMSSGAFLDIINLLEIRL